MKIFFKFFLSFILILISVMLVFILYINKNLPSPNILGEKIISGGTEFFDRSGTVLLYKIGLRRAWIDFERIPPLLIKTFLVAEDDQFYKHQGISLKGIIRSIVLNIKNKKLIYGGSTITQQLARNLFLTQEKTFIRKIKEIILAIKIEKNYSKNQIITYYLNSIYFGNGNIGIKAAADFYFNKKLENLSLAEMAILAAMTKSPAIYAPTNFNNLKKIKERRDIILKKMKDANFISLEEYANALNEEIKISKFKYSGLTAPHFIIESINFIKSLNLPETNDLENNNLKIITTLDLDIQKIAEESVKKGVEKNRKKYGGTNASLMVINPKNGEILALVGSKDFNDETIDGQVNVPFRLRQPGSSFKPLTYASLFELGYTPETVMFDLPTNFGNYNPKNFDNIFKGPVSLRQALAESRNIPAVKAFYLAIPEKVFDLAKKMGMTYLKSWDHYGLTAALGAAEVKMADLIKFYGVLANDGKLVNQTFVLKITKDKKIIYEHKIKEQQIIKPESARMVNDILKDIEARKGLLSRSLNLTIFPGYEVAIKTGTTQFYQDAWAFAYTPSFVVGVWSGNTDGKRMTSLGSSLVAALPIMHDFLTDVIKIGKINQEKFIAYNKKIINKPMLNGKYYSEYGIHDILFYVDRFDPLGPIPSNPELDPQFKKWESSVINWLNENG